MTVFLYSTYDLHHKYDIVILCSGNLSGFRIFSGFFWIFLKSSDFNNSYHIILENWWCTSWIWYDYFLFQNLSELYEFFRIFPDFSGFFRIISNLQISTVLTIFLDRLDGLLLKWDIIIFFFGISSGFQIFLNFSGFFRIFPDFSGFFRIFPDFSEFFRTFDLFDLFDWLDLFWCRASKWCRAYKISSKGSRSSNR